MKYLLFFALLLLGPGGALLAQTEALRAWNSQRIQTQSTGMLVLGGWALGNMALSAALLPGKRGEDQAFHQMQIGWNAINLGIAALGYWGAQRAGYQDWDLYQSIQEQYKMQKILLFNAGLDVGYVAAGAYLRERANNPSAKNPERLRGFGRSIMIQGAFLLAFDLTLFSILANQNGELRPLLPNLSGQVGLQQLELRWRF